MRLQLTYIVIIWSKVYEQLDRAPFKAPTLKFTKPATLKDITLDNFELSGYKSHDKIKGDLAVGV